MDECDKWAAELETALKPLKLAHLAPLFCDKGIDLDILREIDEDRMLALGVSVEDAAKIAKDLPPPPKPKEAKPKAAPKPEVAGEGVPYA